MTFWGARESNAPQIQNLRWEFLRYGIFANKHFLFGKIPSGSDVLGIAKVGLLRLTIVSLIYTDKEIYLIVV